MSEYILTLLAMLISTYLSPIDTSIPPMIDGLTLVVSKMVCPGAKKDFNADSNLDFMSPSRGFAVVTSHTTSPLLAAIISLKALITWFTLLSRPFSAINSRRLVVATFRFTLLPIALNASAFVRRLIEGSFMNSVSFVSVFKRPCGYETNTWQFINGKKINSVNCTTENRMKLLCFPRF